MGIFSSLISGIFGLSSQKSANNANAALNRANLAEQRRQFDLNYGLSQRQFQEQLQWAKDSFKSEQDFSKYMWNANNEYNSASAQRKRLEDAGLNPNLMMNGGSSGTSQLGTTPSASSVSPTGLPYQFNPSMIPMQGVNMEGFLSHLMDNLFNFELKKSNAEKAGAEADLVKKQNDFYAARAMAELALAKSKVRGLDAKSALDRQMHALNAETWDSDIAKHKWDAMSSEARTRMLYSMEALNDATTNEVLLRCKWMPREARARISVACSQVALNAALSGKAKSEAELAVQRALNEELVDKRLMSDKQRKSYAQSVVDKAYWDVEGARRNSGPRTPTNFVLDFTNALDSFTYGGSSKSIQYRWKEYKKRKGIYDWNPAKPHWEQ